MERLGGGPATISQLAEPLDMSLTGLKKHIRSLEETRKLGRLPAENVAEARVVVGVVTCFERFS